MLVFNDPNGRITAVLRVMDSDKSAYSGYIETSDLTVSVLTHYVDGRAIKHKGEQPSPAHEFDYRTKQWLPSRAKAEDVAKRIRAERLAASDWTQLPDVPIATKDVWAKYRQALRDITAQRGYPFDVVWPTPPG